MLIVFKTNYSILARNNLISKLIALLDTIELDIPKSLPNKKVFFYTIVAIKSITKKVLIYYKYKNERICLMIRRCIYIKAEINYSVIYISKR